MNLLHRLRADPLQGQDLVWIEFDLFQRLTRGLVASFGQ